MLMWGKKPLKNYGARMTESILSILRHILRGEKIIKVRLKHSSYLSMYNSLGIEIRVHIIIIYMIYFSKILKNMLTGTRRKRREY